MDRYEQQERSVRIRAERLGISPVQFDEYHRDKYGLLRDAAQAQKGVEEAKLNPPAERILNYIYQVEVTKAQRRLDLIESEAKYIRSLVAGAPVHKAAKPGIK